MESPPVIGAVQYFSYNQYTHTGEHYTCESDGYVRYWLAKGAPARTIYIYDSNDVLITSYVPLSAHSSIDQLSDPLFVKKGMKIAFDYNTGTYAPYTNLYWYPVG